MKLTAAHDSDGVIWSLGVPASFSAARADRFCCRIERELERHRTGELHARLGHQRPITFVLLGPRHP
jgi:hypothetical protein